MFENNTGNIASPAIAIINKPDAVLVNFPTPLSDKGQIHGQFKALQKPMPITLAIATLLLPK